MRNLARHSEALVEDMTSIKRTLPSPSPGPSHQSIPAILVCLHEDINDKLIEDSMKVNGFSDRNTKTNQVKIVTT